MRRHIAAFAGALIMTLGLAGPAIADSSTSVNVSIQENGALTYYLWGAVSPTGTVKVTTYTGGATASINQWLAIEDSRASSSGFSIQFSMSDFKDPSNHVIGKQNISLTRVNKAFLINCFGDDPGDLTANPNNPFQTITRNSVLPVSLANPVVVESGTTGRGCGAVDVTLDYTVNVPAGTYTGGGTAIYTSTLTVTNTGAPS